MSPLGIIAEDRTDVEAIKVLVRRILEAAGRQAPHCPDFSPSSGGCAQMRRKAPKYIRQMAREGCGAFVLVHDRDRNDEAQLRRQMEALVREADARISSHICIPVEELEAWFWSDKEIIGLLGRGAGKAHPSPHNIKSPKEELRRLALKGRGKALATTENPELARLLDLRVCAERCPAFAELQAFILNTCR